VITFIPEPRLEKYFEFDGVSPSREKSSPHATILTDSNTI